MPDISFNPIPFSDDKKVEAFAKKNKVDKNKLDHEGLNAEDVGKMALDTFRKVAGEDGIISRAEVITFTDNQLKESSIVSSLENDLNSGHGFGIPSYKDESGKKINLKWSVKLTDNNGLNISLTNKESGKNISPSDVLFNMMNSKDLDKDGKLDVSKEVIKNQFLDTVKDALEVAGPDQKISDKEAFLHILSVYAPNRLENYKNRFEDFYINFDK